jgi:hypothetical protein
MTKGEKARLPYSRSTKEVRREYEEVRGSTKGVRGEYEGSTRGVRREYERSTKGVQGSTRKYGKYGSLAFSPLLPPNPSHVRDFQHIRPYYVITVGNEDI